MQMTTLPADKKKFTFCLVWIPFIYLFFMLYCSGQVFFFFQGNVIENAVADVAIFSTERVFQVFSCMVLTALFSLRCLLSRGGSHISSLLSSKFLLLKSRFFISLLFSIHFYSINFHFDLHYFHSSAHFGFNFLSFSQLSRQALII